MTGWPSEICSTSVTPGRRRIADTMLSCRVFEPVTRMSGGAIWPVRLPGGSTAWAGSSVGPLDGEAEPDASGDAGELLLPGLDGRSSARVSEPSQPADRVAASSAATTSVARLRTALMAPNGSLPPPVSPDQGRRGG